MDTETIAKLAQYVDYHLGSAPGSNGQLTYVTAWLEQSGLDVGECIEWIVGEGGSCGCEFMLNVYAVTVAGQGGEVSW